MDKVYLLTHSGFDAHGIVAAFTDRNLLNVYLDEHVHKKDLIEYNIIELPVNPLQEEIGQNLLVWIVCVRQDGTLHRLVESELINHIILREVSDIDENRSLLMFSDRDLTYRIMRFRVLAANESDAIELTQKKRLALIESGEWYALPLAPFYLNMG